MGQFPPKGIEGKSRISYQKLELKISIRTYRKIAGFG
jgi:hypothetical protein